MRISPWLWFSVINDFSAVRLLSLTIVERNWLTAFGWLNVTMREIPHIGLWAVDNQATEGATTVRPLAVRAVLRVGHFLVLACLLAIDWYHVYSLRVKAGERAVPPTRRGTISQEQRRRIREHQGNLCMYCGVALLRLNVSQRHIDHKVPVELGGPDEEDNMQALCGRCNSRKGVQTDEEFRVRYRELLRGLRPGRPPSQRISQSRFVEVSKRTPSASLYRGCAEGCFQDTSSKNIFGQRYCRYSLGGSVLPCAGAFFPEHRVGRNCGLLRSGCGIRADLGGFDVAR